MKLELAYNEMSLLRDLVNRQLCSGRRIPNFEEEPLDENEPCISVDQILSRLSRKFDDMENECRQALGQPVILTDRDRRIAKNTIRRLSEAV